MGKRAENKTKIDMWLDRDLKNRFKELTIKDNTCMSDVILEAIQNYVKTKESSLEAK